MLRAERVLSLCLSVSLCARDVTFRGRCGVRASDDNRLWAASYLLTTRATCGDGADDDDDGGGGGGGGDAGGG